MYRDKLNFLFFLFIVLSILSCNSLDHTIQFRKKHIDKSIYDYDYKIGEWEHPNYKKPFSFNGNHRVIVVLDSPSDELHQVIIPWRRRDINPDQKDIIIINSINGEEIKEKHFVEINNEFGHIIFRPDKSSTNYYFYYLPHNSTGGYYPKVEYVKPQKIDSDDNYISRKGVNNLSKIKYAKVISFESIDEFHSFFPMEIISTKEEIKNYFKSINKEFYLFPEYREYPIRMIDYVPKRWIFDNKTVNGLNDNVSKGEYYTFQVGFLSPHKDVDDIDIIFSDLKSSSNIKIDKSNFTCFNKGGIDLDGKVFNKKISVKKGKVQALWFGLNIPKNIKKGTYYSYLLIKPKDNVQDTVYLKINVINKKIKDFGDNNPKLMSRLRWLNSDIGSEKDIIIKPFKKIEVSDNKLRILGREIELNNFGFPKKISSYFSQEMTFIKDDPENILSDKLNFEVTNKNGVIEKFSNISFNLSKDKQTYANWKSENLSKNFKLDVNGLIEYDGMLDYNIQLIAKNDIDIKDVSLNILFNKNAAKYILGLGNKGGLLKNDIDWKWNINNHQEGVWLGNVNKGLQYVLRDDNYERPLNTNFYRSKPLNLPYSWYNDSKGGISIKINNEIVKVNNYSGERSIIKGDTLNFNIRFLITPFKSINTKEHFNTRFVHKYLPVDSVKNLNGTVVNVHHANEINPYINYPFYNIDEQKKYIDEAHSKGIKVKLYNTIRELTYKAYEIFPLKSLGTEIFNDGKGGGHSWLQEHLKANYHSAWHAVSVNDASILNKGTSRWTNYYIEGINWLAKNNFIDGLYLDDIAFSRGTVKRIANVLSENRGSFVIDLHSANQFNIRDGFINSALLYMEHFPFVSRLWFGEYFEYDREPDYWMTEVSGIPFGLTGEMLEKGGRPYHGLIYGMTTRVYHNYNPGNLWKLFKDFNINESRMIGYWVDYIPIKVNNDRIKCTIFQRNNKILISLASWSSKDEFIDLNIDWEAINFNSSSSNLYSPEIKDLQDLNKYNIGEKIEIKANGGLVLILNKNQK